MIFFEVGTDATQIEIASYNKKGYFLSAGNTKAFSFLLTHQNCRSDGLLISVDFRNGHF